MCFLSLLSSTNAASRSWCRSFSDMVPSPKEASRWWRWLVPWRLFRSERKGARLRERERDAVVAVVSGGVVKRRRWWFNGGTDQRRWWLLCAAIELQFDFHQYGLLTCSYFGLERLVVYRSALWLVFTVFHVIKTQTDTCRKKVRSLEHMNGSFLLELIDMRKHWSLCRRLF